MLSDILQDFYDSIDSQDQLEQQESEKQNQQVASEQYQQTQLQTNKQHINHDEYNKQLKLYERTFKVQLNSENFNQADIQNIAGQILLVLEINPQEIQIAVINNQEFDIVPSNMNLVQALHDKIIKQALTLKTMSMIRSIILNKKSLFENTHEIHRIVKKQIMPEIIVFGFIKMDYTQKLNLLNQINQTLQEMHIKNQFIQMYENSILVGFTDQSNLDDFVYGVLSQQYLFKRFGYQQNLMGGKVSKKITFKGIPNDIVELLEPSFKIKIGTNQDGSGYLLCQSEADAAQIFDFLLIQKNKLKKNSGPNKLEVLWQLETLLVNIK